MDAFNRQLIKLTPHVYTLIFNAADNFIILSTSNKDQETFSKSWTLRSNRPLQPGTHKVDGLAHWGAGPPKCQITLWKPRHTELQLVLYCGNWSRLKSKKSRKHYGSSTHLFPNDVMNEVTLIIQGTSRLLMKRTRKKKTQIIRTQIHYPPDGQGNVLCGPDGIVMLWPPDNLVTRSFGHCWYCGSLLSLRFCERGAGTRDHQHPRSRGGGEGRNVVLACPECNNQKSKWLLEEYRNLTTPLPHAAQGKLQWSKRFFAEELDEVIMHLHGEPLSETLQLKLQVPATHPGDLLLQHLLKIKPEELQDMVQRGMHPLCFDPETHDLAAIT